MFGDIDCYLTSGRINMRTARPGLDCEGAAGSSLPFSLLIDPSAFDPDKQAAMFALKGALQQFLASMVMARLSEVTPPSKRMGPPAGAREDARCRCGTLLSAVVF